MAKRNGNKTVRNEKLKEGGLQKTPNFYRSLGAQNVPISRLRGMDVAKNIPRIVEVLEGTCSLTANTIRYSRIYKNVILVNGLLRKTNGDVKLLWPTTEGFFFNNEYVTVGDVNFPVSIGDHYKLKVYTFEE